MGGHARDSSDLLAGVLAGAAPSGEVLTVVDDEVVVLAAELGLGPSHGDFDTVALSVVPGLETSTMEELGQAAAFDSCVELVGRFTGEVAVISGWLSGPDAPARETVAILVRDRRRRDTIVAGLGERGVPVRAVEREAAASGHPLVMTMHRAKGMEFTHVLLYDVGAGSVPRLLKEYDTSDEDRAEALARERSLVYVAATRARDVLAVSWTGDSSAMFD